MRIAILEDEPVQAEVLRALAASAGHDSHVFRDGDAVVRECRRESYDLFVLDWEVPGMSGAEVLAWLRANLREHVPVMFVTGRDREEDIVRVLQSGADDYMTKPVRHAEFLARMGALLRRAYPAREEGRQAYGPYVLDAGTRSVSIAGRDVPMTEKEYRLAELLFRNAGRLLSRGHLVEAAWGRPDSGQSRSLDTHLSRLRQKLDLRAENGYRLASAYSYGYRLEKVEDSAAEAG